MEVLWSLQKKMNVWTIFGPYHNHCIHDKHFQYHVIRLEQGMELSMTANTSASHDSLVMTPIIFYPPPGVFTSKALVWIKKQKRSFRPE